LLEAFGVADITRQPGSTSASA